VQTQKKVATDRLVMTPFNDILINYSSPFVNKVGEGAYRFTEKGTIRIKDGKYMSPIDYIEPRDTSYFMEDEFPTEHFPLKFHLNCGSQVRELAVADCVIVSQEPSTSCRYDSSTHGVWCTRIKMGLHKDLINEIEQHMSDCGFSMENSYDWEEMGGKMWGYATICTDPSSPDCLKIFEVSNGRLQETAPMDFAGKLLSHGKSAVGIGRVVIKGARRLTEGRAMAIDQGAYLRDAFPEPYHVEVHLTNFIVDGWSEEGKLVNAMPENPLVDLPPGFGYQKEDDAGQNAATPHYNDGDISGGSDESETTAAKVEH
jgi:hypothetical protein